MLRRLSHDFVRGCRGLRLRSAALDDSIGSPDGARGELSFQRAQVDQPKRWTAVADNQLRGPELFAMFPICR